MTKKAAFLPALNQKQQFTNENSVHAIGAGYVDGRDKHKMMAPERAYQRTTNQWNLQKTCDGLEFSKAVR